MPYAFPLLITLFLLAGCNLLGGGTPDGLLQVTPTGGTEVMLQVHAGRGEPVTIARGGREVFAFTMTGADTLLTDRGLQPHTTYTWKAGIPGGQATRQATTLDTTSHRFTWQTFRFGQHSSSSLNDVAILGPDNIWAVGEIYRNDSTGTADPMPYNAAHWDGNSWTLKKIPYHYEGQDFYSDLRSILAFNPDDIWFGIANIIYWDGYEYSAINIPNKSFHARINTMWGPSSNDFYVGGQNGNIVHHDSTGWQKVESPTTLDVYDIYGRGDRIIAVAAKHGAHFKKAIIDVNETKAKALSTTGIPYSLHGIWFSEQDVIYTIGSGMYRKPTPNTKARWQPVHPGVSDYYLQAIDANGLNDLWVCGDFGELLHYNGDTWKSFHARFDGILLLDVEVEGDTVVVVGLDGGQAFIALGTRE